MSYHGLMENVRLAIMELRASGWTLAAIARALSVTRRTIDRWFTEDGDPANPGPVLVALRQLERRNVPPRRRVKRSGGG